MERIALKRPRSGRKPSQGSLPLYAGHNEFSFSEPSEGGLELHGIVGRALALAIRFEVNLRSLERFVRIRGQLRRARDQEHFSNIIDSTSKESWTHLSERIKALGQRYHQLLGTGFKGKLTDAANARNRIAHNVTEGLCDRETDCDHEDMLKWILSEVKIIAEADRLLSLLTLLEGGAEVPTAKTLKAYPARARAWVLQA